MMFAALIAGCGDDGGGQADDTTGAMSGFTGGTADDGATGEPTGATGDDSGEADTEQPPQGDLLGLMTFVYSAPNAVRPEPLVGLAGGYRTVELGFSDVEDLWSPLAYQLALPPVPADADTLVADGPLGTFGWGDADEWFKAGNGMKLRIGETGPAALACLVAYHPTNAVPDGYPLYRTTSTGDEACAPSAEAFEPGATYDLVLYGGGAFEDNVLPERVTTPPALEVSAPELGVYDLAIDPAEDLAFAWAAGDDPDAHIEIRLIDADTNLVSVHAADDGSWSIPASELAALAPGPLDIMIARVRTDHVQFTAGSVTVTSRYEHWGFFDLHSP